MAPSKPLNIRMWSLWALISFFYAYQYVLRVLPSIMMEDILQRFHIDADLFGKYAGLYYLGYAGMHIPVGIWLDRYGPRWLIPGGMLLAAMGLLPLLYSNHWIYLVIGRIIIGMGSCAAILGLFKIVRLGFPQEKFAFILGLSVTIGLLGASYGGGPVNYLFNRYGISLILNIIMLLGVILAVSTFIVMPHFEKNVSQLKWYEGLKTILKHPQILMISFFAGLMVGPMEGFADVWAKGYLKLSYPGMTDSTAAYLPSLIFLGMCIGAPLVTWIASKWNIYYLVIINAGLFMAVSFVALLMHWLTPTTMGILFVIMGALCAYQILAITLASFYIKSELAGLTNAFVNMIIMGFGWFFHYVIGKVMMFYWDKQTENGIPIYDVQDYTHALSIIPIGLTIGTLGFIWLKQRSKLFK